MREKQHIIILPGLANDLTLPSRSRVPSRSKIQKIYTTDDQITVKRTVRTRSRKSRFDPDQQQL
jgi:hypothetical protein